MRNTSRGRTLDIPILSQRTNQARRGSRKRPDPLIIDVDGLFALALLAQKLLGSLPCVHFEVPRAARVVGANC
jgi:hypothetical protein